MPSREFPKIRITGRCTLDTEAILKDMPDIIFAETVYLKEQKDIYKKIWSSHYTTIYSAFASKEEKDIFEAAYNNTFKNYFWNELGKSTKEECIDTIRSRFTKEFSKDLHAADDMHISFKCYFKTDDICIISLSGVADTFWLLPSRYIHISEYTDYKNLSASERKALVFTEGSESDIGIVPSEEITYSDALQLKKDAKDLLSSVEAEMQEVKEAKTAELAKLQAEIDSLTEQLKARKKTLLDELELKKNEMEAELNEMEDIVFRLDSEIYAIRCYTGEIVEVNQLRTGAPENADTPIVFYQKMRYLDEELGKIASIYNVDFTDAKCFEELIANRDDVLEAFLPAKRSICLARVSRSGKGFYHTEFPALLERFDKYHGDKVAILIRDGEKLFIAWTDDNRINFSEDAFLRPYTRTLEESEADELRQSDWESDEAYRKRIKKYQKNAIKESLGRYFIFSLLQGMLDRMLIKLPEKVDLADSKYVIFSMADAWIADNRYGTFGDMIDRCNASVKVGDMILMTGNLYARSSNYKNDRGRGYADRTWDVRAKDLEIYPVNLVEHKAKYDYICDHKSRDGLRTEKGSITLTDEEYKDYFRTCSHYEYKSVTKVENSDGYDYFISLLKENSWSGAARANFQVYEEEFINLTFMNSVWLEYVLINNKSGMVHIGGQLVDFAYTIPYLKKALAFIKEREAVTEKQIRQIAPEILEDPEWPTKLSEWMIKNEIHNFSEYRTKQFCRTYIKKSK